ncbi:ferredoxin [Streptomyces venezuelae]|uniref:Ferredoxin n=1 Tax=Streptomyces venezuelae TaxID=54571 RepID=A0A5P2DA88_STRVZ|nr:ferredoxin [Streptomyces venezuelae]QES52072.1 ferredoxin [Streptomyces venezuelae]
MRLVVDLNRCQGYAQCAFLAPDVFAMHGDEGLLYDPQAEEAQRARLAQAVAACPVQAILVDELDLAAAPSGGAQGSAGSGGTAAAEAPGEAADA